MSTPLLTIEHCGCVFNNQITDEYGNRDLYLFYPNVTCNHLKDALNDKFKRGDVQ